MLRGQWADIAKSSFRPGTNANHKRQATLFLQFCQHHKVVALNPPVDIVCCYITWLSTQFKSANSVRNYVSGVRFMHKQCNVECEAMDSFPVACLLRAIDITMRRPPHRMLPITPEILAQLVAMTPQLGAAGPAVKVALLFGFYGMLRMSNIAPTSIATFDPSRHTCRGDVLIQLPGIVLVIKWSKTLQDMGASQLVPLPHMPGHPMDPLQAYLDLLHSSPTSHPNQALLTRQVNGLPEPFTATFLSHLLKDMLTPLALDPGLYSYHSLRRGGATAAYHAGVSVDDIKRHGGWKSESFWAYISAPAVQANPVAQALSDIIITV